jgi:uncharacterized cupin superfamily protein
VALAHWDEVEAVRRELGPMRFTGQDLGGAVGSVGAGVVRYRLDEGDRPTPPHVHGAEEEIFYVLAGDGLSWQDGATYEIRRGDCIVHRAAREAHTVIAGRGGLDVLAFGTRDRVEVGYLPRARGAWLLPTWVETPATPPWEYDWSRGPELWQRELTAGELDVPPPSPRPATIVNVEEVEPVERRRGSIHSHWRDLGRAARSERTGVKHVTVAPACLATPPHAHSAEEEIFVVLDGEGQLDLYPSPSQGSLGGTWGERERHPLRAGSVVGRPAGSGVAHAFRAGRLGMALLAYGTREPNDLAYYPRSNKVYFRGLRLIARVEALDYWDGED